MEKLRVYYDREGNTLSVWFDDPKKEHVCEEADENMVLVKDRDGRVIGFERLNYLSAKQRRAGVRQHSRGSSHGLTSLGAVAIVRADVVSCEIGRRSRRQNLPIVVLLAITG